MLDFNYWLNTVLFKMNSESSVSQTSQINAVASFYTVLPDEACGVGALQES